jgi:hypothetical protein
VNQVCGGFDLIPINFSGDSFYSEKDKILYYCIPKVASRSILDVCAQTFYDGYRFSEKQIYQHPSFSSKEKYPFRFSIVRDPIERALSFYFDKCVNYDNSEGKRLLFSRYKNLSYSMQLKEFIRWLTTEEGSDNNADHHFCSQYLFIYSSSGKKCVDHLGYLNTLDEDLAYVWARLGHEIPLLKCLNSNSNSKERKKFILSRKYLSYLDSSDIRILQKRYEADYELFKFKSIWRTSFLKIRRKIRESII